MTDIQKPAFPQYQPHPDPFSHGMTLRDYFAAKAMQGYISDPEWRIDMDNRATAYCAYKLADSMLKARDGH